MALSVEIEKQLGDFRLEVQFQAEQETLALLGASGCGKSVTLKCIAGIVTPDAGRIALDGVTAEDVLDMTERLTVKDTPLGRVSVREAYYSAADICGIVEEACRLALEQLQAAKSKTPIPLTRAMFEKAFEKIPPSISAKVLKEYEEFR